MKKCFVCNSVRLNRDLEVIPSKEGNLTVCIDKDNCDELYIKRVMNSYEMQISFLAEMFDKTVEDVLKDSVKSYCEAVILQLQNTEEGFSIREMLEQEEVEHSEV